jgi:hypothetical protein
MKAVAGIENQFENQLLAFSLWLLAKSKAKQKACRRDRTGSFGFS